MVALEVLQTSTTPVDEPVVRITISYALTTGHYCIKTQALKDLRLGSKVTFQKNYCKLFSQIYNKRGSKQIYVLEKPGPNSK